MRNILVSISAMILLVIIVLLASILLDMNENIYVKNSNILKKSESKADTPSNHKKSIFSSHLPLVLIETDGQTIKNEETIWSKIKVIDNQNGRNDLEDEYDFQTAATLEYRGNSSVMFDKKQYHIEFYKKREGKKERNISVMGMAEDSDWILNGPYLDKTLIRNRLFYGVSRDIMDWAPDTRYCEVFIDGVYKGLYLMIESVKVCNSRINLKDFSLIDGQTPYLLKRERSETEKSVINSFGTYSGKTWHELSIKYPKAKKLMENQKEWIRKDVSEFERVLYSNQFDDIETGYAKYIDVNSFIDYYIINEFTMNVDAGYLSTYVYKDLGGKFKMVPWDFNNSLDNYQWFQHYPWKFYVYSNNWYQRLFQDRNFTKKVVKRYHELRKGVLSDEYLLRTIDDNVLYLGDAVDRNFEVWGYTFHKNLLIGDRDIESYEEAIGQLKNKIIERGKFLDENIETLYQYAIN